MSGREKNMLSSFGIATDGAAAKADTARAAVERKAIAEAEEIIIVY